MPYSIKEIFYTIQGEGFYAGRPAVFCRFTKCNLWSGKEADRSTAVCQFCDTDFLGTNGLNGGEYTSPDSLVDVICSLWPKQKSIQTKIFAVFTGGEPLLQLDSALIEKLHEKEIIIAVETNGTIQPPRNIDWLCVSPKANSKMVQMSGDELKLVYPQLGINPSDYTCLKFRHFFLQPMDGPEINENTHKSIQYCLNNPQWKLSLQTQKSLGIP
jgi:7-carboxy-7-deazaguanine synthase